MQPEVLLGGDLEREEVVVPSGSTYENLHPVGRGESPCDLALGRSHRLRLPGHLYNSPNVRRAAAITLLLALSGAASEAQTIRVQWDRKVDFSRYQSFAWVEGTAAIDPEVNQVLVESIENELSVRGIFPDEAAAALYVAYHASAREEFQVEGGYRRDWEDSGGLKVDSHLAGTLVVDLVDASENRVVWRAIATATVSGNRKKARGRIPSVVQKMFADFPPPAPESP